MTPRSSIPRIDRRRDPSGMTVRLGCLLHARGPSSRFGELKRQLEHHLTGAYSAANRHPMG